MKNSGVLNRKHTRFSYTFVAVLTVGMLLSGLTGSASAVPLVSKDGKIHACYRVKGKPRGALRVVWSAKTHCRRGERRVAWSASGATGQAGSDAPAGAGQQGQSGSAGAGGQSGVAGPGSTNATLSTDVAALTLKLEALEDVLKGVAPGDLTGAIGTLNGVDNTELTNTVDAVKGLTNTDLTDTVDTVKGLSNTELTEAVNMLPAVDSACTQATNLTTQVNSLGTAVGGIGLNGVLTGLGGVINIPTLPTALAPFSCPSP